ncbi:MAG: glycosyltransferase family 4 protein [Solirubrobacteraceae bacterium]
MRLCVYTDYAYSEVDGTIYGQRAFVTFMCEVGANFDELIVLGRLEPGGGRSRYPLPPGTKFVGLPYYESLTQPASVLVALGRSLRTVWRELDEEVDAVWLFGPYLHSFVYALLAFVRKRPIVLGVRQELVQYTRTRHPGRRLLLLAAHIEEWGWRLLARFSSTVVVGPSLARSYRKARSLLPVSVSLVRDEDIVKPASVTRSYEGELRVLAVGRLDSEKNPLLLAEVLANLCLRDPRWRMEICGEGSLEDALGERLVELGVADRAEIHGYIPFTELREVYRDAHAFLHVSWTEGVPQVLFEAWAAALPVVATAVGGVPEAAEGAALLIPPGDAYAASDALDCVATDAVFRAELIAAGHARVLDRTLQTEAGRVAGFIRKIAGRASADGQ